MGAVVSKKHAVVDPEGDSDKVNTKKSGGFLGCCGGVGGDDDSEAEEKGDEVDHRDKNRYIDPPMPYMGKTMNFKKLMDRSLYARKVSAEILKVVNKDALSSAEQSMNIPVTNDMYRVVITKEIMDNMAKRNKQKHINQMIKGNLNTIQRALEYRKMTLNLMNMNYSNALVRNLDLTTLDQSRAYTEYRVVDRPDVPASEFATRRKGGDEGSVDNSPAKP